MIYSNPEFILLLVSSLIAYSLAKSQRGRFGVLLAASTVFYAWVGWVDLLIFELVMLVCWATVFFASIYPGRKRQFITAGIVVVVLHLVTWKYLSWMVSQVQEVFPGFLKGAHLKLVVPLGISFYTLQKIAYMVDVYRKRAEPIRLREYLLLNGFFAQLVAGPITRASVLMPQLRNLAPLRAANAWVGLNLFAIGFFKKVVIADTLGVFVDRVFADPHHFLRRDLLLAVIAFTSQIWADFSGYTDMGRGAAKMFGIELPENFLSPFLAKGPSEFWRRWHITLTEWIRDYIFVPLWIRHESALGSVGVVFVTLLFAGIWHGADWIFVLYGLYWGALILAEHYWRRTLIFRRGFRRFPTWLQWLAAISLNYVLLLFSRVLFRAGNIGNLRTYLDAFLAHPGSEFGSYHPKLIWSLILISFLYQIVFYQSLEPGAQPLWRRFHDRWMGQLIQWREWSQPAVGATVTIFGIILALTFMGAVSPSLRPKSSRPFIYWSGLANSKP